MRCGLKFIRILISTTHYRGCRLRRFMSIIYTVITPIYGFHILPIQPPIPARQSAIPSLWPWLPASNSFLVNLTLFYDNTEAPMAFADIDG